MPNHPEFRLRASIALMGLLRLLQSVLDHLQHARADFAAGVQRQGLPRRFKVTVDSTVIELVANFMDWAKHRRRKAAAMMMLGEKLDRFL